jgi:RNA polymerase sigma-70 factor (ECF subfamily)
MTTVMIPTNGSEALARELGEIFREHGQFVYRTAYSVTGNRPDAEDVLQNIFAKLLARAISPGLKRNPRAYLYRSAINLSLNIVRSRRNPVTRIPFTGICLRPWPNSIPGRLRF